MGKENKSIIQEYGGMPLISVIVPVYNAEKTLRQCVDSVLSQEFKNFELLLIDDGSKDESPSICDEYAWKDSRVKVFHKTNGGVSSARNIGLDNIHGEWVTFIDSDDYITQGFFDDVEGRRENLLIKGYMCLSNKGLNNGVDVSLIEENDLSSFLQKYLTHAFMRGPVLKFYRREWVKDIRFLEDMRIGEDVQFVFRYLTRCQSYKLLSKGQYVIRLAEEEDGVKYAITVDYAVKSLTHLKNSFDNLIISHKVDKSLFLSYIGYFKRISFNDWGNDKNNWYGNKGVKALYRYVWPALSFKQKARLFFSILLKR